MPRVAVVDENDIFRTGLVACLEAEGIAVVHQSATDAPPAGAADLAVVAPIAIDRGGFDCPLVLCTDDPQRAASAAARAVVPRNGLTANQLVAAVNAVASGLEVRASRGPFTPPVLDERRRAILELLAAGADTRAISSKLAYSERTIKGLIIELERELDARTRAQAVARGIRLGLI
jgi:DNA-binding NarL/FixJ family response regulator